MLDRITPLILTRDEEANIGRTLDGSITYNVNDTGRYLFETFRAMMAAAAIGSPMAGRGQCLQLNAL